MAYDHERKPRMFRSLNDMLSPEFRDPIMDPESGKWLLTEEDTPETEENSGPYKEYGRRKNHPDKNTDSANGWLDDFLEHKFPEMGWLIEPMIPAKGIVFMHGPTSAGKSPFTWAIAVAVAEGTPFSGMPVRKKGPVLYIELDTPSALIQPRLDMLPKPVPPLIWMEVFQKPIDICGLTEDHPTHLRLHALQRRVKPVLVIVNTLRKAHAEDDKDSAVPMLVYSAWRDYFPEATLFFVHHDKKTPPVKDGAKRDMVNQDQMFSGNQHWADDSQVALHLMPGKKVGGDEEEGQKTPITVKMTKSQVSDHEKFPPLQMRLNSDGTNWTHSGPAMYRAFFQKLPKEWKRKQKIDAVMEEFTLGKTAAYDACIGLK